ncbi:MAG: hypothetical protein ACLFMQ_07105, partial [Desulfohalobiaceae bacterium]
MQGVKGLQARQIPFLLGSWHGCRLEPCTQSFDQIAGDGYKRIISSRRKKTVQDYHQILTEVQRHLA